MRDIAIGAGYGLMFSAALIGLGYIALHMIGLL